MAKKKKRKSTSGPEFADDKPFSSCEAELLSILSASRISLSQDIITSRDRGMKKIDRALRCSDVPKGFSRWRLPFFLKGEGVNFYISTSNSGVKVKKHSHKHGPVIRFILEGSIRFQKREYVTGDWIYIPEGVKYGFTVGPRGASFILGYQCCCG